MDACLAVDIGGTKLAAGAVTGDGELLVHTSVPTPKGTDPEALFSVLAGLVTDVMSQRPGLVSCGVGCGGPMSAPITILPRLLTCWLTVDHKTYSYR